MGEDIVAVDVGGTFTDICVLRRDTGELRVAKVPSTANPIKGVMTGVERAGIDLSEVALFSHGTTVATNALITGTYPAAAMVTTKGFRDVIEIRRGTKEDLWDAYKDVPPPPIRRRHRFEVAERVDYTGNVLEPLDEEDAREVARLLKRHGVEAVAVCFINSYANPANEQRMRDLLEEELDGVLVTTSSEVLPEIFEHERFSTTIANAVLQPLVGRYVRNLESELRSGGYRGDLVILHSGGGVMTPETADRWAVRLAASGIAAGAIASRHIGQLCGFENTIGFDMGGTSTDISLVYEGEARTTTEWSVQYGYPIRFPSIEVLTIGAGGGSLAWIDDAGSLRNGPQSAGADPGPACYGQGGAEPTNTDANLVLGRLGAELIDGAMTLDPGKAEEALTRVAEPLGLGVTEAAEAVIAVANANMADAIRLISVRRGYDPREFALVCFGGAGPLHGAALARELAIPTVLVPPNPGTTSALGCLLVDIRHDFFTLLLGTVDDIDARQVEREFAQLEEQAMERMRVEGVAADKVELQRTIDMRYAGQWRSIAVPVDGEVSSLADLARTFEDEHDREHSYRREGSPIEVYRLNLRAVGATQKAELARYERQGSMPDPIARRRVHFGGGDAVEAPIYRRADVPAGATFEGPAVLEQLDSTVLVPPGSRVEVDEWLNVRMTTEEAR
jgi:N-methylhydantoinase A